MGTETRLSLRTGSMPMFFEATTPSKENKFGKSPVYAISAPCYRLASDGRFAERHGPIKVAFTCRRIFTKCTFSGPIANAVDIATSAAIKQHRGFRIGCWGTVHERI
jgi:hypothetical protein